jgi:hypothetical protein
MDYIGKRQRPNVSNHMHDGLNDVDKKPNTLIGSKVRQHRGQF